MRVLLDEHLPRTLAAALPGHDVRTVRGMGWGALKNGVLLRQAVADGFAVMLTMDRNVPSQQNLAQIGIALLILRAPDSSLDSLKPLIPAILDALDDLQPGTFRVVGPLP